MISHFKLRQIEVLSTEISGRPVIALRDPAGISEGTLCLPRAAAFILQFFNGTCSCLDIKAEYMRKHGQFLFDEDLNALISQLDEHHLLENENFLNHKKEVEQAYRVCPIRAAHHAGKSYEGDGEKLYRQLEGYFSNITQQPDIDASRSNGKENISGLIVPHIDIRAGGECFALAYTELSRAELPNLCVILGTGHGGCERLFSLTRKDFQTPLGIFRSDSAFIDDMTSRTETDFLSDELIHKTEHSIEFQVVFLQFLMRKLGLDPDSIRMVPVLCSFGYEDLDPERSGSVFEEFTTALKTGLKKYHEKVLVIASADLAHLGPRYGNVTGLSDRDLRVLEAEDAETIRYMTEQDVEGFVAAIRRDRDKRNICGFAPISAMLEVMPPSRGRLLKYDVTCMDQQGSHVSFASVVFHPL